MIKFILRRNNVKYKKEILYIIFVVICISIVRLIVEYRIGFLLLYVFIFNLSFFVFFLDDMGKFL